MGVLGRRRRTALVALLALMAVVATGCPFAKAGTRCQGTGWAHDNGYVLQCRGSRWTRVMTFRQYLLLLDALKKEQERRASSAARAQYLRGTTGWVDVYDWSPTWNTYKSPGSTPPFTLSRIDRMADNGISTLWIQTAKAELPDAVLDHDLLVSIIAKARSRGMRVVGWYLPTFADPAADQAHLSATAALGVDGIGIDIEARLVDLANRNPRLVVESAWLRATYPGMPLAAIVLPPVVTDVINTSYWPQFPWHDIAPSYDVWMPMSYWTNRTAGTEWRDAYHYTAENIDRTRANLGVADAVVNPIGGLSDQATVADVDGFVRACTERGAIGGGLYDDGISTTDQYAHLAPLNH